MKRLILSILVVLAIATVSLGCKSDNTSSGNTELQGSWSATDPEDSKTSITCTFDGNQFTMTMASTGMSVQISGTFTLNLTASPKAIDLVFTSFPMETDWVGKTSLGIYEVSGNSVKLDFGDPGEARLAVFSEEALILIKQ